MALVVFVEEAERAIKMSTEILYLLYWQCASPRLKLHGSDLQ